MQLDQYSNPIFEEKDIFDAIYQGYKFSGDPLIVKERTDELINLENQIGTKFLLSSNAEISIEEFDALNQTNWFMPDEYKQYDIVDWLYCECKTIEQKDRVTEELKAFAERDMILLLKWLKYFVDTMTKNNIVWGVGRGSSVASYVLFLMGVHNIDSLKYNLDWHEFLR
jgi:DNA polymerase III alpha subunit